MSQIHDGPLATYSSLTDKNLAGYFANTRMRRHLRKAGLVDKRGQIISENQFRLNMARKEHKKHVKDLLAQAIVHKTLDMERNRQVEIKRKLEEISKLELVRRVRADTKKRSDSVVMPLLTPRLRPPPPAPESVEEEELDNALTPHSLAQEFRKGDEDILPYLSPRSSRPQSRSRFRPRSAPSVEQRQYNNGSEADIIYVDDEGRPVTPPKDLQDENGRKREEIDTRHLYALDSAALKKYALTLSRIEQGEGLTSPYLISQVPTPPRSARASSKNSYRDNRHKPRLNRPRTANSLSPYRSHRTGAVQGTLMLHRQEPAMMHQGEVQTLCEVTMKYYGPNLILPRDQRDPTQDVEIEQQHCGGNTLPVFKERIKPGDEFTFISRRHRGYPFSLSIFVDGRISARVSTCCEYGHAKGVRLGGKMGQFCLKSVNGATPCYKCKLNAQASPRTPKRPSSKKRPQKVEEIKEEIIVLRKEKKKEQDEEEEEEKVEVPVEGANADDDDDDNTRSHNAYIKTDTDSERSDNKSNDNINNDEDKYDDDFEDDSGDRKDSGDKYKDDFESEEEPPARRRSRSRSSSSSSSSSRSRSRSTTPAPRKEFEDNRKIYGLRADEEVKKGSDSERSDIPRKVEGHSDEDEQPESKKWTQRQEPEKKKRRGSTSSSSSSSSVRSRDSFKEKKIAPTYQASETTTTTEETKTESTVSDTRVSVERDRNGRRPSSSSSDSDSGVKRYSKKLEEDEIRRDEEERRIQRKQEEDKRREEQEARMRQRREEEEKRRQEQEKRMEQRRQDESRQEEERKKRELEQKREEEHRIWAEEEARKRAEEKRKKDEIDRKRREAFANRKSSAIHISSTPDMDYIPEPVSYSRIYEDERVAAVQAVQAEDERVAPVQAVQAEETKTEKAQQGYVENVSRSNRSSTSSESEREKPKLVTPARVTSPYKKSSSSSSSDSETETDTGRKGEGTPPRPTTPSKITPPRSRASSSSSSSSDSETETDADKKVVKSPSPVQRVASPKKRSSSGSSSSSETTTTTDTKAIVEAPPKVETKTTMESASSSSSSSSDSETETDNEKVKRPVKTPQPLNPIVETKQRDNESSSSDSETETATETATETETDNEKVKKELVQQKEKMPVIVEKGKKSSSSGTSGTSGTSGSSSSSDSETETEKKVETLPTVKEEKKEEVKQEAKKDTTTTEDSSSGSSDSSSDSSDSEDEDKKKKDEAAREKTDIPPEKQESTDVSPPLEDKQGEITSDEPFISESEGEQKPVTIFASESEGDNMHGGNDPDNLASSNPEVKSFHAKIGVSPGQPVEGAVGPLIEGKKDIELNNIALTSSQVAEVADAVSKGNDIQSVCLRNTDIDDNKFGLIVESLKTTKSNPMMLNFNLNKMKSPSMEKILEVLVYKPSVDILLLHGNPLGDDGVKVLVNGILDIHQAFNQKEAHQQEVKGETTKYCVLKELDLGDTDFGDEGMGYVAHLLENDLDLKTLNLNGNTRVGYSGWKRLGKALKKNKTLKSLTLDFNKIGDEGIAALVSGLKVNTSLQTLDLESTSLTEEGGKILVDLVKCNTTILEITVLPGNRILDKTQEEIRNYLGLNKAASSKILSITK